MFILVNYDLGRVALMDSELGTRGSEFDASQRRKRSVSDTEKNLLTPMGLEKILEPSARARPQTRRKN